MSFESVAGLWSEGQRRLERADPVDAPILRRVTDALVDELRRRVGGRFTSRELADFYLECGTDWCFAIATAVAPTTPAAWDMTTVAGAAFARYAREAGDYMIGRRTADG